LNPEDTRGLLPAANAISSLVKSVHLLATFASHKKPKNAKNESVHGLIHTRSVQYTRRGMKPVRFSRQSQSLPGPKRRESERACHCVVPSMTSANTKLIRGQAAA
jgi:hypothetical protein